MSSNQVQHSDGANGLILFDVISELKKTGVLQNLVRSGVIGSRAPIYHAIFERFNEELSKRPNQKMMIVENLMREFQVEQATIYRARKMMTMPV